MSSVNVTAETEEQKLKREMKEFFKGTAVGEMLK